MGLISAGLVSLNSVLADQWKEYFICDAMPADVLMCRGEKRNATGNNRGNDNVISNGSGIVVNEGQAMIITDQGKIVEFCAEAGKFTYDSSSSPSIFTGKLGENLLAIFKELGERFAYAGEVGKDQRVYYFNIKDMLDNKFGTPNPIPFRVVDARIGLDIDVSLRCSGTFTYKIVDPMTFYTKRCGNRKEFRRDTDNLDAALKADFISALQPCVGKLSALQIRPSELPLHTAELETVMKEALNASWTEEQGISIGKISITTVDVPKEQQDKITEAQMYSNSAIAGAHLVGSLGDAMVDAANNANGAVNGILGVNMMAGGVGGTISDLLGGTAAPAAPAAAGWTCPTCGKVNEGNFCPACGTAKPAPAGSWTCPTCGRVNDSNFCPDCGTKKPAAGWTCPTCGTQNEGKFCTNCGTAKA